MTARTLLLIALLVPLSGCMTLVQATEEGGPAIYGGTRLWLGQKPDARVIREQPATSRLVTETTRPIYMGNLSGLELLVALWIVDAPFCLAADTALLPVSLGNTFVRRVANEQELRREGPDRSCH